MNNTLKALVTKYGTEKVIARIMEQFRLLAISEDEEVKKAVKELIASSGCDTEYIYSLCEYTNLVTYAAEEAVVTDSPWSDEDSKAEIMSFDNIR